MTLQLPRSLFVFLIFGIIAVHGQSRIRFANAQASPHWPSDVTLATQDWGPIDTLNATNSPSKVVFRDYLTLPQQEPWLPLDEQIPFFPYQSTYGIALAPPSYAVLTRQSELHLRGCRRS
jgi:hypothetical protein